MPYSPEERTRVLELFGADTGGASDMTFRYVTFKTGLPEDAVGDILSDLLYNQEIRIEITSGTSFCTFSRTAPPSPVPPATPTPFDDAISGDIYLNKNTGSLVVYLGTQRTPAVKLRYVPVHPTDSKDTVTVNLDTEWSQQFTRIWSQRAA